MKHLKLLLFPSLLLCVIVSEVEAKKILTAPDAQRFSVREIVDYECVETIDPKFVRLLCSALKDHLLEKGADIKSGSNHLAHDIQVRLSLEMVTDDSISGWMEWTRCKDAKCGPWTKTGVIQSVVMDSVVRPSTYREFIIGLFIHAEKTTQIDRR